MTGGLIDYNSILINCLSEGKRVRQFTWLENANCAQPTAHTHTHTQQACAHKLYAIRKFLSMEMVFHERIETAEIYRLCNVALSISFFHHSVGASIFYGSYK